MDGLQDTCLIMKSIRPSFHSYVMTEIQGVFDENENYMPLTLKQTALNDVDIIS